LEEFRHDRGFVTQTADPGFTFRLRPALGGRHREQARQWLIGYYNQLGKSGFHPNICIHSSDYFTSQKWWDGFYETNPRQRMCSVCDGTLNHGQTIEHYFPKSEYPVLSVHPANLIPVCKKCNNEFKKNQDPLDGFDITQVFIPYQHQIRAEIELDFTSTANGREEISLRSATNNPELPTRLQRYSDLFGIPKQWNDNIHEISEIAWHVLSYRIEILQEEGVPLDQNSLREAIGRTCDRMEQDWGNFHYLYPATGWLRWARENKFAYICAEFGVT